MFKSEFEDVNGFPIERNNGLRFISLPGTHLVVFPERCSTEMRHILFFRISTKGTIVGFMAKDAVKE